MAVASLGAYTDSMARGRHAEFGALVRRWRTLRRATQARISDRAGVSTRHWSFLETGRSRPSREMVAVIADTLALSPRAKNELLRAAGFADAYPEHALDSAAIEPARRALEFMLARLEPFPSVVIDGDWNVVLANRAARCLLAVFAANPPTGMLNVLRLVLVGALRPHVENFAELATTLLARLEREVVGVPAEAKLRRLLVELRHAAGVPATPDMSDVVDAAAPLPFVPLVLCRGDIRLSLFSMISSFGTPIDLTLHDLRVETLFPADAATESALEQWSRRPHQPPTPTADVPARRRNRRDEDSNARVVALLDREQKTGPQTRRSAGRLRLATQLPPTKRPRQ
jgi:transcriptional regulator with XRE-family HTH domain